MLTIIICSCNSIWAAEKEDFSRVSTLSKREQWRRIKDINKADGTIYTSPHRDSVLRKMFIERNLDYRGIVKDGEYDLNLIGFKIHYVLYTKHKFNPNKF